MRVLIGSALYPTPLAPRTLGGAEIFARDLAERLAGTGDAVAALRASGAGIPADETAETEALRAALAGIAAEPGILPALADAALRTGRAHTFDDVVGAYRDLYGRVRADAVPAGTLALRAAA